MFDVCKGATATAAGMPENIKQMHSCITTLQWLFSDQYSSSEVLIWWHHSYADSCNTRAPNANGRCVMKSKIQLNIR